MAPSLLETVQTIQRRAANLEQEAALLREELARLIEVLTEDSPVVARYVIQGETYEVTQADIKMVRARMIEPRSEETLQELALADKMAAGTTHLSRAEKSQLLQEAIKASRAEAIINGTALENEWEAALYLI